MRNVWRLLTLVAALAFLGSTFAQAPKALPSSVRNAIAEMGQDCRDSGGIAKKAPELLTAVELTGDQWPDYIINQGAFNCEGNAAIFSGSGGSEVFVYVGTKRMELAPIAEIEFVR